MSISLKESALQIITNNPEHIVPLYDVLLFMGQPKAALTDDYDETKELLYSMTPDARKHQKLYEKARTAA